MKIRFNYIIQILLLFCICICCNNDKTDEDEIDYSLIDPKTGAYTFPLRPGMPEWAELKSNEEMIAAVQIPENILNVLTDSGLVNTCFTYPLLLEYIAYPPDINGIAIVISRFNGLQELMLRPGVPSVMLYKYKKYELIENISEIYESFQKLDSLFRFCYFEYLLSADRILSKLTDEQLKELFIEALKKFNQKINYNYSFATSVSTAFLLAKIMFYKEFEPLLSNDSMMYFVHSSELRDISFSDIIDTANDFVQTFKE